MKSHASMNRIYRLVWNAALNLWVAVAENAKGRGKAGSARNKAALLMLVPLSALMHQAGAADAANATVSAGAASVATAGNTTTISQASQRAAIDWTSLSTRANEALVFNQPNAQAIALNRITGSSPSELLGSLTANGQVFILNPNGVLFGAGSQVNVGGLVASTLSMSNADFMNGNHVFTGSGGSGSVVNQGTLSAAPGGYLALLAPEVRNEGVMTASLGTALLAAGNKVTLNLDNGSLLGYSIDQGAINALAENKQLIQANGGQVLLGAKALDSLTTATVNNTGVIEAKTLQNKAGRILLMGDMQTGTVNVGGTLDASAPTGGDGGFIETSAAHVKVASGARVTTRAATGKTGKWLIDPNDFTIAASGGDMDAATVEANLANTNFEIQTATMGSAGSGDIKVNQALGWSSANTLTLTAERNIEINQAITAAAGGLTLNAVGSIGAPAAVTVGTFTLAGGSWSQLGSLPVFSAADFRISGGTFVRALGGDGSSATPYQLADAYGLQGAGSAGMLGKSYTLANNIDASGTSLWNGGEGFKPIGDDTTAFTGSFDGGNHLVSNLTINRPFTDYVGLFGSTSGSVIRNVGLVGGSFAGGRYTGALIGKSQGSTLSNVYATGGVSGSTEVGGLMGWSQNDTISNAHAAGSVGGWTHVGGLVGTNAASTLTNVYATGSVSSNVPGGSSASLGGLVGYNLYGIISNAYASGSVNGSYDNSDSNSPYFGTYSSDKVGGLVGEDLGGTVSNAYATGSVSGNRYVGGLVGSTVQGSYRNVYAVGSVSGAANVGGLAGSNAGSFTNSLWDIGTTGQAGSAGGTGLSSAQMMQAASFSGWDLATGGGSASVWRIYEGHTAPLLRSLMTALAVTADDVSKTYDRTTALSGGSYTLGSGADSSLIFGTAAYGSTGSQNVGSYSVGISGLYSSQQGYDLNILNGTATITPVTLTLSGATAAGKVYDGTTAATVTGGTLGGVLSGDTVTLSGSGAFDNKNVGSGKTVIAGLSGADGGNYVVAAGGTTADITVATLTVSDPYQILSKTYDGTTAASFFLIGSIGSGLSGVFGGDRVTLIANFDSKNAGSNKTVRFGVSGVDAGNYVMAAGNTIAATNGFISSAALTVSGTTAAGKTYDGTTGAAVSGGTLSGLIAGDTVGLSQSGSFTDKNAAAGKTVNYSSSLSGADAGNYFLVASGAGSTTADITAATLTVNGTATAANKTYNGSTAASVSGAALDGVIGGDSVSLGGAFDNKNVGSGKTVTLGLLGTDAGNYVIAAGSTTADITAATLTVNGTTAANKTYDGTTGATLSGSLGGLVVGDAVALNQSGSFSDKNAATGKTVSYTSSLSGADAGNYVLASASGTTTADIRQASLSISGITAADKTYNASDAVTVNTSGASYNGLIAGDVVNVVATGLFSDKNAGAGKTVNLNSSYSGADVGNYAITGQATTTASISQAALTVSGITAADKTYNASDAATVNTTGAAYNGLFAGDVVSVAATGLFTDKNAGANKTVNLSSSYAGADAGNYAITNQATTTASISQASLTVTGITAADKTYNASDAATVNTTGVAYNGLFAGDVVTVSATGLFADKNVGTGKTVTLGSSYSGADAGNYTITGQATTTASISQAALTISGITAGDKTYNASDAATVNTAGAAYNGLFAGDVVSVAATGLFSDKNAGANKTVNLSSSYTGADAGNYAITSQASTTATINQAALTVSGITAADKTYNASDAATVNTTGASYSGLFAGDVVAVNATGQFSDKNAGVGKTVTLSSSYSGADAGNYLVTSQASTTASISQAALTISGITAGDKTYNASDAATVNTAGASYNGLFAGDVVSVAATGLFSDKNAGAGKTVNLSSSYSGADVGNYAITNQATTTASIGQAALTISGITAGDKTYNASDAATVNTAGAAYNGLFAGDVVNVAATGLFSDKNAGAGKTVNLSSSYTGADAGNYIITGQATTTASISQAALNISGITAADKTYNASDAATISTAGASYSGLFAGDVVSVNATGVFSDKNVGAGKTVTLGSSYGGADAGNYSITGQGSTTASISQASLTISGITAADKTYNASDAATINTAGAAYNGLFAGDVVSVAATGLFSDKNAGTGKTVNLSSSYSGADAGNYVITGQATTTATIGQAALTVSGITAGDKIYDAGTVATVSTAGASYGGLFAGDVVNVAATGLFSDKNAGAGKTVNLSSSYTGVDAGNYAITSQAGTTATINKADLTVQATGSSKVYDGNKAATVALSNNGLVGDVLTVTGSASFADSNAGLNKAVSVTGVAVGGTDAGNYNLIGGGIASTTASITPKQLTVTANNDTQMGGSPYSGGNGVSYSGLVTGDTAATVLAGSLAYGGSAQGAYLAGEYDITPGGLLANGNYSLRFVQGKLTLSGGDAASAALGGTALVGAYQTSLNTLSVGSLVPRVSVDDSKGTGEGGAAATALNAAAAEGADQGGGN
ncbi:YDG domain-containing protein [Polaromonas sp. YR568]|uniref:YDG domain-containing protein n=1 Tax=Polaromonas sp. YR568 TaxID=1855301 RepID=UPI00398C1DAE